MNNQKVSWNNNKAQSTAQSTKHNEQRTTNNEQRTKKSNQQNPNVPGHTHKRRVLNLWFLFWGYCRGHPRHFIPQPSRVVSFHHGHGKPSTVNFDQFYFLHVLVEQTSIAKGHTFLIGQRIQQCHGFGDAGQRYVVDRIDHDVLWNTRTFQHVPRPRHKDALAFDVKIDRLVVGQRVKRRLTDFQQLHGHQLMQVLHGHGHVQFGRTPPHDQIKAPPTMSLFFDQLVHCRF
jgi:hypothetical protein